MLIFLALRHWLTPASRVLILDPTYGEQLADLILNPSDVRTTDELAFLVAMSGSRDLQYGNIVALLEDNVRMIYEYDAWLDYVEVVDVATPVTIERFTGNWRGMQAWMDLSAGPLEMFTGAGKTLPELDNFYMVGQWAGGIGLSTAAIGGRKLIRRICKGDRRPFVTSVP